ncbi:MAG: TonB-dependent receptor [Casimicrobiaceae bacterium]
MYSTRKVGWVTRLREGAGCSAMALAALASAQTSERMDPVVVTATRVAERAFDLPIAIDSVDAAQIQQDQLQINLSESLGRVPGIVVQNRGNYAQDLMISSRGFGARANFGVRGVRLFQDGIPATMPDGQGQASSFSLVSAKRVEVMRGPFSTLYGNASGGVISIFTEDGPDPPMAQAQFVGGSYGNSNTIAKFEGAKPGFNYVLAGNVFHIDGYREHSEASRDLANVKLRFDIGDSSTLTVIGNSLHQPEAQDPLGLTKAQWYVDPRQADTAAVLFDTRKTVNQQQGGATWEQRLTPDTRVRVTGYGGTRMVRQYLAFTGVAATSSGGVTDLGNNYGGIDARVTTRYEVAGGSLQLSAGATYDTQHQQRRGYVNNFGQLGDLRRDEQDNVSDSDAYVQAEWSLPSFSLLAGLRYSDVRFVSTDHYITGANPDDSGSVRYGKPTPVIGGVWHATNEINVYANYGVGFETPTFAELAYKPVGPGLNLALQPAVSKSAEIGVKVLMPGQQRAVVSLFTIDTTDEIVIDTSTGGRTTYRNASKTRRRGVEAQWEGRLGSFGAYASYTYLLAQFEGTTSTGSPPQIIPSGARLPGVPGQSAYAELTWSKPDWYGFSAALEAQYADKVYVNDRNTDYAPAYVVGNVRAGFQQTAGGWTFTEFVRLNNFTGRNYSGTVIVGDTNGRFFEPSAERNFLVGLTANVRF